jgi:Signal transduction histidine kinase
MLPNERTTRDEVAAAPGVVEGLIVAPDRQCARPLVEFLRSEGVNVQVVNSPDLGFEEALLHRPNVVLIDERISKAGGVDLCERLKANSRTHFLPVIMFDHGKQSDLLRLDALAAGADALFSPSTSKEERRARLWALLRSQAIFRKLDAKRQTQNSAICDKRRWVRGLVHDIQNSLGTIQANFEYIAQQPETRDKKLREEFEECVQDTRATFREMVRSLRTVLEFERFEAGDVTLKEGKILLSDICQSVASSLAHMALGARKEIVVENSSYALPIHGDANYVKEAVTNLANFVLRQPENQTCFLCASSDGGVARLRVYGDKHQIAVAARRGIFDPYTGHLKEKPAGAAHRVGLALAKVIVEVHHGSIGVEETPSAGTAFVIEFPSHWSSRGQRSSE